MKRKVLLFMAAITIAGMLAGCSNTKDDNTNQNNNTENNTGNNTESSSESKDQNNVQSTGPNVSNDTEQNGEAGLGYKMGLGVISRMKRVVNAGTTDGSAEVDTVIAAVTVDEDDRIVGCTLDMIQHVIPVSATGEISTPAQTEFLTKKEIGDDYGMKKASEIGKEWYEQAQAFEQYAIGKTTEEINGIDTDDHGYIQNDGLSSSVSISITDFQAAITKAVENAY